MIIILEGIDCSGKSTLLDDIYHKVYEGTSRFAFKNPWKPEGKDPFMIGRTAGIYLGAYEAAMQSGTDVIFDRGHITELIYSAKRGYDANKYFRWDLYEIDKLERNAVLIYMSAPASVLQERFKKEKEDYLSIADIDVILRRYEEYLEETPLRTLKLSSLDPRKLNVMKVVNFLNERSTNGH